MQSDTQSTPGLSPKKKRRLIRWAGRLFIGLIALVVFIIAFIHLPFVQRWGIKKITVSMEKTLESKVTIGGFTLNPISDLTLRNVYIGSPFRPADTLIYAKRLSIDYKHIWDLFKRQFSIQQIGIEEGTLNIHRMATDSLTNLDWALLKLMPARDTSKPQFVLDLEQIDANDLRVYIDDEVTGALMKLFLNRADVEIDTMDIVNSYLDIKNLDLDAPRIMAVNRVVVRDTNRVIASSGKTWSIDVDKLEMADGIISIENLNHPRANFKDPMGMDYAHLLIDDVDLTMDSLKVRGWDFDGKNIEMHVVHHNGFEINQIASSRARISRNGIFLDDFKLITPRSTIQNSIALHFSGFDDFKSFPDSVRIEIPAANLKVFMHDLLAIAPGLQNVDFFYQNAQKEIRLQGNVNGYVNRLKVSGMNAEMGGVRLTGNLRSHDLAIPGSQLISLDLTNSTFSARSLKEIFPNMKIPPEFDRLGRVSFTGKYDGYPNDFVAFGTFDTELGRVIVDLNLNTVHGMEKGKYSGKVSLENFDIGALTGIKDIGRVTLSGKVIEGTGLNVKTMVADVTGQLSSLTYKGYTYRNARVDGQLTGKLFNGTMDINDPNIDMHFEGIADFRDSIPRLDFVARVDSIKLMELGFAKEPIYVSGYFDMDLTGIKPAQINGNIYGENIRLVKKGDVYRLDTITLLADVDTVTQDRFYHVESDIVSGTIRGKFNPVTLASHVQQYLSEKYPSSIDPPKKIYPGKDEQRIHWDLTIKDTKHWLEVAGINDLEIKNTKTTGGLDLGQDTISGTIDLPELHYANVNVYGSYITFNEKNGRSDVDLQIIAADLKENLFFEDVLLQGVATDDSIRVRFKTDDLADIIDEIDLDIAADPEAGTWNLSFSPRKLKMLDSDWQVPPGNRIEIRDKYINIENFELVSGNQRIKIEDIDNKGLKADIIGFDVSYLNDLWVNDKFKFSGEYSLFVDIDNIYDIRRLHTTIRVPALMVNNVPYGVWELNASMENPKDSVRIDLNMHHNETKLTGEGAYLPPIKSIPKEDQNYLRMNLVTTDFPLDFLEFLLGGNIRDTEGSVDMVMSLKGKTNRLVPNGVGKVYSGSTTIDYLGAAYSFHDQSFKITDNMIDLSGAKLYDVMGNSATIQGGLTHRYLRDLGLSATISSPKIIGLDVTSEENESFYGTGVGSVFATFTGSVANPVMVIDMTTARGTHIYIPLMAEGTASESDFVIFLENGMLPASKANSKPLSGIDLTMNMTVTNDAIIEIVFDDRTGEVMRGSGSGDLTLHMSRTGNMNMFGRFEIEKGDYLFTNFSIIKKPFIIEQGSAIEWTGDPYDATLAIKAQYKGLEAPPYTFIQEYLVNASNETVSLARRRTRVDLTMILTGSLLHPDIEFDLAFPDLTGELKGYTDAKINTLKANENAMNQQVVGLLFTRSFLPTSNAVNAQAFTQGIDNTLSELLSATFSSYLGSLLGDLIPQGKVLSGIDFQVAVDINVDDFTGTNLDEYQESEVEVDLPLEFFNDRLAVNLGGNYVKGSFFEANEYFAGDVMFEYQITPDRRLKVRAYNRSTLTVEGRKNITGFGIGYKNEYNSLPEIFGKKKTPRDTMPKDSTWIPPDTPEIPPEGGQH